MGSPRRRTSVLVLLAAPPLLAVAFAVPAVAAAPAAPAAPTMIADWEMNELPGATVLVDSSGHHFNGNIGSAVTLDGSFNFFDVRSHKLGTPVTPQHLDVVPNFAGLSPGTQDYSITLRLKWTAALPDVNLVQKGQGSAHGWKVESAKGHVRCQFIGSVGQATVKSTDFTSKTWADNQFHIVTCSRTASAVTLTIDGKLIGQTNHVTGDITNTWPVSIAGKTQCDNITVTCDYWSGWIDYIRITSP
jgi:Concanavalin A-like lectin/glucanases superfamily